MSGEYLVRNWTCISSEQDYIKGLKAWRTSLRKSCKKVELGPEDKDCKTFKQSTNNAIQNLSSNNKKKSLKEWSKIKGQCQGKKPQTDLFLSAIQMSQFAIKMIKTCNGYPLDQEALKKAHEEFYRPESEISLPKTEDRKPLETIAPKTLPDKEIPLGSGNLFINPKTGTLLIRAEGNHLKIANKEYIKEWWGNKSTGEKVNIERTLIDEEEQANINTEKGVDFSIEDSSIATNYLRDRNISLCPDRIFGANEEDVKAWLLKEESGYPDLAKKLIYLLKNRMIPVPPNAKSINLSRINGAYQKALGKDYERPTFHHSLFLLKIVYEQIYNYYYGE